MIAGHYDLSVVVMFGKYGYSTYDWIIYCSLRHMIALRNLTNCAALKMVRHFLRVTPLWSSLQKVGDSTR